MFKYILEGIGNINILAILSLLTFVAMFLIGAVTIFRRRPEFIEKMSNLPLEDNAIQTDETNTNHEN
jgi:hypothetical protein